MAEMDIHGNQRRKTRPVGLWDRLNEIVIDLGNWIDDNSETIDSIVSILSRIGLVIAYLGFLIWVIYIWVDKGWWQGVLSLMFTCGMAFLVGYIITLIQRVILCVIIVIRHVFWNIYTLLGTIAVIAIITAIF